MAGQSTLEILLQAKDKTGPVLDKAEGRLEKTQKRLNKMRTPALLAGAAVAGIGIAAIKFASDLDEAINKAEVTFGDASGVIAAFALDSATSFGISKRAANEYTGTIGTILTASGLAQDAAADMSIEIIELASDMASFNNIELDEAIGKLRSGLVGETEPLRTVGVLLSEAAVTAEAYRSGIADVGEQLTDGEKVQARYKLILEQTEVQQGDFARTSKDVANAQRVVQARVEDAAAALGTQLLPIAAKVIGAVSALVGWFGDLSPKVRAAILIVGGITLGLSLLVVVLGPVIGLVLGLAGAMATAAASGGLLAGVMAIMAGPAGIALLVGGAVAVTAAILKMKDGIKDATEVLDPGMAVASETAAGGVDTLTTSVGKVSVAIGDLTWDYSQSTKALKELDQQQGIFRTSTGEAVKVASQYAFVEEDLVQLEADRLKMMERITAAEEKRALMIERTTDKLGDYRRGLAGLGSSAIIGPIGRTTEALLKLGSAAITGSSELVTALADANQMILDHDTAVGDSRVGWEGWQKRAEEAAQVGAMVVAPMFTAIADEAGKATVKVLSMSDQLNAIMDDAFERVAVALGGSIAGGTPAFSGQTSADIGGVAIGELQAKFGAALDAAKTGTPKGENMLKGFLSGLSRGQLNILSNRSGLFGQVAGGVTGEVRTVVEQHINIYGDNFGAEGFVEKVAEVVGELTATGALSDVQVGASPSQLAGQPG